MNLVEKKRKKEKKQLSYANKQKISELAKKAKNLNWKNLVDKIYKLIVKEFKPNVNCHIKIGRLTTFFKSNNA